MDRDTPAKQQPRIDAAEVNWVEVTDDGRRVCLRLRDQAGRPAAVSLPADSLNALLSAVPRPGSQLLADADRDVYPLDGWSLSQDVRGLVLTLHLADGARIAFVVTPSQIAAMASLAGQGLAPRRGRLN